MAHLIPSLGTLRMLRDTKIGSVEGCLNGLERRGYQRVVLLTWRCVFLIPKQSSCVLAICRE